MTATMNATEAVSPMCAAALTYAERGWQVFPAEFGSEDEKKSHKAAEHSNGRAWGATTDAAEIRRDFRKWPDAIGVVTGPKSGIFVVEADTPEGHDVDGITSLKALEAIHGPLPATRTGISPSGSIHYYFCWPRECTIRNSTSKIGLGIDVRGEGGMVIAPPSVRPGKGSYRWLHDIAIAEAPQWLIELATADDGDEERAPNEDLTADPDLIAAAMAVVPNDDVSQNEYNKVGMAIWVATGGCARGFEIFDTWARKSKKYHGGTVKRWRHYFKSPPSRIGAGSIIHWANEASPGWWAQYDDASMDKTTQESLAGVDAFLAGHHGEKPPTDKPQDKASGSSDQTKNDASGPDTKTKEAPAASSGLMPVDLWASFPPPELPADLLPKVIENYARAEAKTMGADVAGIAMGRRSRQARSRSRATRSMTLSRRCCSLRHRRASPTCCARPKKCNASSSTRACGYAFCCTVMALLSRWRGKTAKKLNLTHQECAGS